MVLFGIVLALGISGPAAAQKKLSTRQTKMVSADVTAKVYYRDGCPAQAAKLTQMTLQEAKARGFKSKKCK